MALFRGIQEYIALVFDSGNIVNISGYIFLYPPQLQGHPILYKYIQGRRPQFRLLAKYIHKTVRTDTDRARYDWLLLMIK